MHSNHIHPVACADILTVFKLCAKTFVYLGNDDKADKGKLDMLIRPPDKSAKLKIIFLISQPKHMFWVLKRTISIRWFF